MAASKEPPKVNSVLPSLGSSLDKLPGREKWSSKWEYLLSLAGIAIGLGNVWRFPYICYRNGGGAFLIPYFLMLIFAGLPIFLLESSIGQFSSSGCIAIYEATPAFKGIGYTSLLVTMIASTYYSVVIAYPLVFLPHSLQWDLPWASCDNPWNTPHCVKFDPELHDFRNESITATSASEERSPADEFFHLRILKISSGITQANKFVLPIVVATVLVWTFVFLCIFKGVKVVGKVVWFTSTFPFLMLFVLLIRGLTLPGAVDGVKYFLYPNFSQLLNYQVWADAASQIFFSLQVGWGSIVAMGSYNGYRNNSLKDALWIPILNCATSILAGVVVFAILGFMAYSKNVSVADVVSAGPSLAFITYPEALAMMPLAPLWAVLFFLMLFFLGIDSCFVQIETMVASLGDEFPRLRSHKSVTSFVLCFFMFGCSLVFCTEGGMYMLTLFDNYSVTIPISVACLAEVLVFAYSYGGGALVQDIQAMTSRHLSKFWWASWMLFTPITLMLIATNNFIDVWHLENSYGQYVFPAWTKGLGWSLILVSLSAIPVVWLLTIFLTSGTLLQRIRRSHVPSPKWGPKNVEERLEWEDTSTRFPLMKRFFHPDVGTFLETKGKTMLGELPSYFKSRQKC